MTSSNTYRRLYQNATAASNFVHEWLCLWWRERPFLTVRVCVRVAWYGQILAHVELSDIHVVFGTE